MGITFGKSSLARVGIIVNVTPAEPGWEGHLTLELSNTSASPIRLYADMGIAQMLFFQSTEPNVSYAKRKGKYQHQKKEVVYAKV